MHYNDWRLVPASDLDVHSWSFGLVKDVPSLYAPRTFGMKSDLLHVLHYASPASSPASYGRALGYHFLGFVAAGLCAAVVAIFWLDLGNRYVGAVLSLAFDVVFITVAGAMSVAELLAIGWAVLRVERRTIRVSSALACVASGIAAALLFCVPIILDFMLTDQTAVTPGGDPASSGAGVALGLMLTFAVHPLLLVRVAAKQ